MQKSSQFPAVPRPKSAQQDMKAKLEEVLLGNKGAAREMMQRHSRVMLGNDELAVLWPCEKLGWCCVELHYGIVLRNNSDPVFLAAL